MVTFAELKNGQVEGLKKVIEIVERNKDKMRTDQKEAVERTLLETKEVLAQLERAGPTGPPPTPGEEKEEDVKFTKAEVDKIMAVLRKQRELLGALKEYVGLEGKMSTKIVGEVDKIQKAKSWVEVKGQIDTVRELLRKENVVLINREQMKVAAFIEEERKIRAAYERIAGFLDALFHKVKRPDPRDPHYALYLELEPLFEGMHTNLDEQARITKLLADIFRILVGPTGMSKKLIDELDAQKSTIKRDFEDKGIRCSHDDCVRIMKMIKAAMTVINEAVQKQVVALNKLQGNIEEMIKQVQRAERFLEEKAKKLAE